MNMKIAFVGVGSIAKRHIENIIKYFKKNDIDYSIDIYRSGKGKPLEEELRKKISNVFNINDNIKTNYDVIFITNPTSQHFETLLKFYENSKSFFIEKPIFDTYEINKSIISKLNKKLCYVACPLRYSNVIEYIKNNIDLSNVLSIRAICSSYLPNWRQETDYRNCYSSHKDLGGGVDLDLIHELDYITYLFGEIEEIYSIRNKISNLEIDSNDLSIYIAKNKKVIIELHLDYYGQIPQREIEIYTNNDVIKCNILTNTINYLVNNETIVLNEDSNDFYYKETEHFFDILFNKTKNDNDLEQAIKVLRNAKGVI